MNKEIWLWLLLVMLPHNERTMKLVEHYNNDVRTTAEAIRDGKCDMLTDDERERACGIRSREVNSIIAECESNNIRIVTIEDEEYPDILKGIYSPPVVLFVQGSLDGLSALTSLAVVGARNPSRYGVTAAKQICTELAGLGMVIVSGLAVGIDTAAHESALEKGARTIGVLACGNLVDYPAASRGLKQSIIRNGGAIISELPPHTAVDPEYFRHRNRIISGLAHGTFVVEAREHSGSLLTAEHAVQQGRELFCLPPYDIFSHSCTGVVPYLRDGATPVFGYVDIVEAFKFRLFHEMEE